MLQDRLLNYDRIEGRIVPRWLTARDDVWLRALVEEGESMAGCTVAEADERASDFVASVSRRHGVSRRAALGAWTVERRRWRSRVDSPVPPEKIREVVFSLAVGRRREEALAEATRQLGLEESVILASLFADRERARRLVAPSEGPSAVALAERYNLALAQSLILRSTEVVATIREQARHVVRYAKLHGLMASFEMATGPEQGTIARVSGPLSLFHETTKYGRALSGLLATLATTAGWAMAARVVLGGVAYDLVLDAAAPLARTHVLPRSTDSAIEKAFARDLRRKSRGWSLIREDTVVRVGTRLFFPDFTLLSGRRRVLVEIVGYWTPDYLAKKTEALAAVDAPLVVCVDQRHADAVASLRSSVIVLPFRKHIDPDALLDAAESLVKAS